MIMKWFIESAEISVYDGFSGSWSGFGKGKRDLLNQDQGLDGDVECGFMRDKEKGVEMCIDSGFLTGISQ